MKTNIKLFITLVFSLLLCSYQSSLAKSVTPEETWYKDADNDSYSDGITLISDTQPDGYKLAGDLIATSGDCNDDDAAINPATVWYKDADNDGYSDGSTLTQCDQPTDYKLPDNLAATSGDCNDDDAAINPTTIWYKDADNDGYSDGSNLTQCDQPTNYKLPGNLAATSGDCNDADAAINILTAVTAGSYGPLCSNGTPINLAGEPSGGVWSGTGVSGDQGSGYTFNPAAGPRILTYTYSNGTCSGSDQTTIIVNTAPTVTAGSYGPLCSNGVPINLLGEPSGGVWSGTGVNGDQGSGYTFNPAAGSRTLTYTYNDGTCSNSNKTMIVVNTLPAKPVISGPNSVTQQQTGLVYSVTEIAGETYTWTVPGSAQIISGQNSSSITVTWGTTSGNITCTASNNCGSSNTTKYPVTVCSLPAKPVISGPATVTKRQTGLVYSVTEVAGETYIWTVPLSAQIISGQNSSSVTINWGPTSGTITCTANNNCGSSKTTKYKVSLCILPAKPVISGPAFVDNQQTGLVYSVNHTEGETYTWTVPASAQIVSGQGDSSITVNWGTGPGKITCTANNNCGSSATTNFRIEIGSGIAALENGRSDNSKLNQMQTTLWITPNPALNNTMAMFTIGKAGKYVIELADLTGRLLQTTPVIANAGANQVNINLHNYANGTYLVSLTGDEIRKTIKLVKAR